MKFDAKKILLTGTALVAVSFALTPAAMAATEVVNGGNLTPTIAADPNGAPAVDFQADGTATVNDGISLTGTAGAAVTTSAPNQGTLILSGSSDVTGTVGDSTNTLKAINYGANGSTVTFDSEAHAVTSTFTGTGSVEYNATGTSGSGTIDFAGNNGQVTFGTAVTTVGQTIGNSAAAFNGKIVSQSGLGDTITFSNSIGADAAIASVSQKGAGTATFSDTVSAQNITIDTAGGALDFNDNVTGDIKMNQAGAVTLSGATLLTGNIDMNGTSGTVVLEDGADVTGNITSEADGAAGTVTFEGDSTFSGNVGGDGTGVATLNLNSASGKVAAIDGDVTATDVNIGDEGGATVTGALTASTVDFTNVGTLTVDGKATITTGVTFGADGTLTVGDTSSIGAIDSSTNDGDGTVVFTKGATVTGAVGATNALKAIDLNGVGTVSLDSTVDVGDINFGAAANLALGGKTTVTNDIDFKGNNGSVTLNGTTTLTGDVVTSTTSNKGTLTLGGTETKVDGSVGGASKLLAQVNLDGSTSAEITGDVYATSISVGSAGTHTVGGDITGDVTFDADGTLTIADTKTLTGSVDNGTLTDGAGTLAFDGAGTVTGNIGSTNTLKAIDLNGVGTVSLDGTVDVADINFGAAANLALGGKTTVTNDIDFKGNDGSVTLNGTTTLTGDVVTSTTSNKGTLTLGGTETKVDGSVGGASKLLAQVNLDGSASTEITGDVYATSISVGSAGTHTVGGDINGDVTFDADGELALTGGNNITGNVDSVSSGTGTLTFTLAGDSTVSGTVGATKALSAVNIGLTDVAFDGGTFNVNDVTFTDAGSATIAAKTVGSMIDFAGKAASVTFASGSTFSGDAISNGSLAGSGDGKVSFSAGSAATVTGKLGTDENVLAEVEFLDAATLSNDVYADTVTLGGASKTVAAQSINGNVVFDADGTLSIDDGDSVFGNISHSVTSGTVGTVTFIGDGTVTGTIGDVGQPLKQINVNGTAKTVTLKDTVHVADIEFGSNGLLSLEGDATVTNDIDFKGNNGSLQLSGGRTLTVDNIVGGGTVSFIGASNTIAGNVGTGSNTVDTLAFGTGVSNTVDGNVDVENLSFGSNGSGTITGTLDIEMFTIGFAYDLTVDGLLTGDATLDNAGAKLTLNGGIDGDIDFVDGGEAIIGDEATITGDVTGDEGSGKLTFAGDSVFAGDIIDLGTVSIGAGTVTLNGAYDAATLAFTGIGVANLNSVTSFSDAVNFAAGNGMVSFSQDITSFTGSATNGGGGNAGKGNLAFGGSVTIDPAATVGAASASLNSVSFNGGAGKTATVGDAIYANTINIGGVGKVLANANLVGNVVFGADGVLNIADTVNTGNLTTSGNNIGTVEIAGASSIGSFGSNGHLLKSLTLSGTDETVSVDGNMYAATTTTVGTNTLDVAGNFVAGDALNFTVGSKTVGQNIVVYSGQILVDGMATVDSDTAVTVTVDTDEYIADGKQFVLINGDGGTGVATLEDLTIVNSALITYSQDDSEEDLIIVANRKAMDTVASSSATTGVAKMLDDLGAGGDADIDALQTRLSSASSDEEVQDLLDSVTPDVSGGAVTAAMNVSGSTGNVIGFRLADLRAGEIGSGVATGNGYMNGARLWGQTFGSTADQDERDGIAGYEADTYGFMVGADTENLADNLTIGLAFAYANTDVDAKDINRSNTEVDSYQASLYGDYDIDDRTFIAGQMSYIYGQNDVSRYDVGGIAGNTATGDFDTNQFVARAEVGRDYYVQKDMTLTPSLLMNYQYVDFDSYSETGAGGLALTDVDTDAMQIFELGVNLVSEWNLHQKDGSLLRPNVHAGYRYDFIGDQVDTAASLAGGGTAFSSQGADPAQHKFNVGAGLTYECLNNWELSANYDFEYKEDYDAHTGFVRAAYKF